MSISDYKFKLRAMQPSDSAAVANLITEFDGDMTTRFLLDAYTAITSGTEYHTLGVVVECAGYDGFVGMGTVRFNNVQYNGEILPHAFLDGLKVHKNFRGQGLGYQQEQPAPDRKTWEFQDSEGKLHRGEDWVVDMVKQLYI